MSSTTQSTAVDILDHILTNVLLADNDSLYRKAFAAEGIEDVHDFLSLSPDEISQLTYCKDGVPNVDGSTRFLKRVQIAKLTSILEWYAAQGIPDAAVFFKLTKLSLMRFIQETACKRARSLLVGFDGSSLSASNLMSLTATTATTPQRKQ